MSENEDALQLLSELECINLGSLFKTMNTNRFLLIDDNEIDSKILQSRLWTRRKNLLIKNTSIQDWVDENCPLPYDIDKTAIFIDLEIPHTDGREIARILRMKCANVVLIAFTATIPIDTKRIHELFDGILLKPVSKKCIDLLFSR